MSKIGHLPLLLGALGLVAPAEGWAASYEDDIDILEARAEQISGRAIALDGQTSTGKYLTDAEAVTRFQDYLFLHLVGEHGPAAEGFFALVTTGSLSDSGLHRDAEWYLAEALVGLENYKTAASRFRVIVDDSSHPFRDDAVRRLLELYAAAGNTDEFRTLYDDEIVTGRVKPTGLITYSLAKSFYTQEEYEDAKSYFEQVPVDNAWYARAMYFLGTIAVVEGDLDTAVGHFQSVSETSVQTAEDWLTYDLALMALGRIHYHIEDYFQASEYYNRVGGDSAYQADKLYEIIWTSIRRDNWRDALNNVEIFLLAFSDHEYAAQLKLLQGHLNFQEQNWTDALESYEQVIIDYTPVHQRFASLSSPGSSAEAEVRQVIENAEGASDLPPYAVAMMRNDPELGRAMRVFQELDGEERDIEVSERIITELQSIVSGSAAMGSFENLRLEALQFRSDSLRARVDLMAANGSWLGTLSNADAASQLPALEQKRLAIVSRLDAADIQIGDARSIQEGYERRVGDLRAEADNVRREAEAAEADLARLRAELTGLTSLDAAQRDQLTTDIANLEVDLGDARIRLTDIDSQLSSVTMPRVLDTVQPADTDKVFAEISNLVREYVKARPTRPGLLLGDRIDATDGKLEASYVTLGEVVDAVSNVEKSEVGKVQKRFEEEVVEVGRQRADHVATLGTARDVSLGLTRDGFGRLEDFFANSVLNADMGIVDVYWAQKLEVDDELTRVKTDKDELLAELEARFRLIKEKLGDRP